MADGYILTDEQKEACAVGVMRTMLEDYSERHGVPFDAALAAFAQSPCYDALFDFDTRLWAEGPDYLASLFEDNLQ